MKTNNKIACLSICLALCAPAAHAGVFDWFKKDKCREYSDYTCEELESVYFYVYHYWPATFEDKYVGMSYGLKECRHKAYDFAVEHEIAYDYICCLSADGSTCAEKHR